MRGPGRAAVGGMLAGAMLLGLNVVPASAGPDDLVVTFDQPGDDALLDNSPVTLSGTVNTKPGLNLLSTGVDRIVVRIGDGPEIEVCRSCGGTPRPFSATVTLPRNGAYQAEASAEGRGQLAGVPLTAVGGRGTRSFRLEAPPRAPQDVRLDVSSDRVVTLSWARNTEPDLLHYAVFRKDPGSDTYRRTGGDVDQPGSGRPSFVDGGTAGGGDFAYQIVAVRAGAGAGRRVSSPPTTGRSVSVPAPPPPTDPGSTVPGTGGTGGDGQPAAGGPPRADISAFLAGQAGPSLPTPPRVLDLPDTGFNRDLPFGARPPGEELEEGDELADPRSLDVGTSTSEFVSRGRPLVPVAGGAVLLLLAVHLRLLNKRVKAAPATVGGKALTDLPHLDPDAGDQGSDDPEPTWLPAAADPVLFDYEEPLPAPDADEIWSEEEWDEEQVWEVVSPAR